MREKRYGLTGGTQQELLNTLSHLIFTIAILIFTMRSLNIFDTIFYNKPLRHYLCKQTWPSALEIPLINTILSADSSNVCIAKNVSRITKIIVGQHYIYVTFWKIALTFWYCEINRHR